MDTTSKTTRLHRNGKVNRARTDQHSSGRMGKQARKVIRDVQEMGSTAWDIAQEKLGDLREGASEYKDQGQDQVQQVEHTVEKFIREHPVKTILIAAVPVWFLVAFGCVANCVDSWESGAMATRQCSRTRSTRPRAAEVRFANEDQTRNVAKGVEHDGVTTLGAMKLLRKQVRELKEYLLYYAAAKTDRIMLCLRNTVLWTLLSALGFVVLSGFLITAGWFLLTGLAGGLGVLFGDRLWIANIVTGVFVLVVLGLGMYYAVAKWMRISRNRTIQDYEERQTRQQIEFGHSVGVQTTNTVSANQ